MEIRLLNRDVMIRIEGSDDFGNLLGTVHHPNGDISLLLLSNGFAKVNNATAQLTEAPAKLRQAMKDAQANRLRRWKVRKEGPFFFCPFPPPSSSSALAQLDTFFSHSRLLMHQKLLCCSQGEKALRHISPSLLRP